MFFYLHEFDHSSPKKTEASKLTANHVGLTPKKEKTEQDLFYVFRILQGQSKWTDELGDHPYITSAHYWTFSDPPLL